MRVYIKNQQKSKSLDLHRITRDLRRALLLLGLHNAELSILFVNDRRMRRLNSEYRGIDAPTDVLSFPMSVKNSNSRICVPIGDIVVSIPTAVVQAGEYSISLYDELLRLLVHGLLHLIGYDHEINRYQKTKMEKKERELLRAVKTVA